MCHGICFFKYIFGDKIKKKLGFACQIGGICDGMRMFTNWGIRSGVTCSSCSMAHSHSMGKVRSSSQCVIPVKIKIKIFYKNSTEQCQWLITRKK